MHKMHKTMPLCGSTAGKRSCKHLASTWPRGGSEMQQTSHVVWSQLGEANLRKYMVSKWIAWFMVYASLCDSGVKHQTTALQAEFSELSPLGSCHLACKALLIISCQYTILIDVYRCLKSPLRQTMAIDPNCKSGSDASLVKFTIKQL